MSIKSTILIAFYTFAGFLITSCEVESVASEDLLAIVDGDRTEEASIEEELDKVTENIIGDWNLVDYSFQDDIFSVQLVSSTYILNVDSTESLNPDTTVFEELILTDLSGEYTVEVNGELENQPLTDLFGITGFPGLTATGIPNLGSDLTDPNDPISIDIISLTATTLIIERTEKIGSVVETFTFNREAKDTATEETGGETGSVTLDGYGNLNGVWNLTNLSYNSSEITGDLIGSTYRFQITQDTNNNNLTFSDVSGIFSIEDQRETFSSINRVIEFRAVFGGGVLRARTNGLISINRTDPSGDIRLSVENVTNENLTITITGNDLNHTYTFEKNIEESATLALTAAKEAETLVVAAAVEATTATAATLAAEAEMSIYKALAEAAVAAAAQATTDAEVTTAREEALDALDKATASEDAAVKAAEEAVEAAESAVEQAAIATAAAAQATTAATATQATTVAENVAAVAAIATEKATAATAAAENAKTVLTEVENITAEIRTLTAATTATTAQATAETAAAEAAVALTELQTAAAEATAAVAAAAIATTDVELEAATEAAITATTAVENAAATATAAATAAETAAETAATAAITATEAAATAATEIANTAATTANAAATAAAIAATEAATTAATASAIAEATVIETAELTADSRAEAALIDPTTEDEIDIELGEDANIPGSWDLVALTSNTSSITGELDASSYVLTITQASNNNNLTLVESGSFTIKDQTETFTTIADIVDFRSLHGGGVLRARTNGLISIDRPADDNDIRLTIARFTKNFLVITIANVDKTIENSYTFKRIASERIE